MGRGEFLSLNYYNPYSGAFNRDSPSKLVTGGSIRQRSPWRLYVFHWQGISNARKKCLVVFISVNFSTTVTHGSQTVFKLMTEFKLFELMMILYTTEKLFIKSKLFLFLLYNLSLLK